MRAFCLSLLAAGLLFADPLDEGHGWGGRLGGRRNLVARGGGTQGPGSTEAAVTAGLKWLARVQAPDGRWKSDPEGLGPPRFRGRGSHDVGTTGLALMAFLGAGYTSLSREAYVDPHTRAEICWGDSIRKSLRWLASIQARDGRFSEPWRPFDPMDQALATTALVEAYGLTNAVVLKEPAKRALEALVDCRRASSVWGRSDDAVLSAVCAMAFRAARFAELDVPKSAVDAENFRIVGLTEFGTGRVCAAEKEFLGSRPSSERARREGLTAAGMLVRIFTRRDAKDPQLKVAADWLLATLPQSRCRSSDSLGWFLGSNALFQLGPYREAPVWKPWNEALIEAVLPLQVEKGQGATEGSWDPKKDRWGGTGNRAMVTAVMVLTLETYYRYPAAFRTWTK